MITITKERPVRADGLINYETQLSTDRVQDMVVREVGLDENSRPDKLTRTATLHDLEQKHSAWRVIGVMGQFGIRGTADLEQWALQAPPAQILAFGAALFSLSGFVTLDGFRIVRNTNECGTPTFSFEGHCRPYSGDQPYQSEGRVKNDWSTGLMLSKKMRL